MRIVSLVPAATEICFALELGSDVVGVSPECDYPPAAAQLPRISRSRLDFEGKASAATSRLVGETLAKGEALYQVDEKALRAASPDIILTQGLCEVCAPMADDVRTVASHLPSRPRVVSLDPHSLRDVLEDIERVGRACGVSGTASSLVADLRERIERVGFLASHVPDRPTCLCLEWLDPLFLAGHWVPEMVDIAGGRSVLAKPGEKSPRVEAKAVALSVPDVVVLMPCGFHLDRTLQEARALAAQPWWPDLPAVRRGRVWVADGSSYFNRPGPRLVTGLEILAHIVHPEIFKGPPSVKDAVPWVG